MHPEIINRTPLALSLLYLGAEPDGALHAVALAQGTWRIGTDGKLGLIELQHEAPAAGQWYGDPATTSLRLEPQTATAKPSTDVVLLGDAVALGGKPVTQLDLSLSIALATGAVGKRALVIGDRSLSVGLGGSSISPPQPFDRMPLVYERAFGGWDRRHEDPARHRCEARNPVGVGFRDPGLPACDEPRLPNIEDPHQRYGGSGDRPAPCGFGFIGANWLPRATWAGTYDADWDRNRKPLLPLDFDARFHNAASAGLVMPAPLGGQEWMQVEGMSERGPCRWQLPGLPAPWCAFSLRRQDRRTQRTMLDTVIIDMKQRWLTLQWRARWPLPDGPHALRAIELRLPSAA